MCAPRQHNPSGAPARSSPIGILAVSAPSSVEVIVHFSTPPQAERSPSAVVWTFTFQPGKALVRMSATMLSVGQ